MYSFEGQFRRLPEQNLAGASRKEERGELLHRAHSERLQREQCRLREQSTLCIQAYMRSYQVRLKQKAIQREEFDVMVKQIGNNSPDDNILSYLVQKLIFFYNQDSDVNRIIFVSRQVLKRYESLLIACSTSTIWQYRLKKLLLQNLKLFRPGQTRDTLAIPLRLLEVLTSYQTLEKVLDSSQTAQFLNQAFTYLVKNGYMERLRYLLDSSTPPLLSASSNPPTPLAACLLDMVVRPLDLVNRLINSDFSSLILSEFCKQMLCPELSEPIKLFLLPALSVHENFPFIEFRSLLNRRIQPMTPWLLYSFLVLDPKETFRSTAHLEEYLQVLEGLTSNLSKLANIQTVESEDDYDSDSENDQGVPKEEIKILEECTVMLNDSTRVRNLIDWIHKTEEPTVMQAMCKFCHNMLISSKISIHKYKLLYLLALQPQFLRILWSDILSVTQQSLFGSHTPLLSILARGLPMTYLDSMVIVPLLATFCSLFSLLVATLHDTEFFNDGNDLSIRSETMPFDLTELAGMCVRLKDVSLGLVELAFPESRPSVRNEYKFAVCPKENEEYYTNANTVMWTHLFKSCVGLMRQLYTRDLRRPFCPEGHWISQTVSLNLESPADLTLRRRHRLRQIYRPFHSIPALTRKELEEGPPLSTKEVRTLTILQELPFVVAFHERVLAFQSLIIKDKMAHQSTARYYLQGPFIQISVRRNYLYEDAFDKLSLENEPELRQVMKVQMVSTVGLHEAGVDGGGVFREFLSELLKTAFDPNRGFFRLTKDNLLYPNPHVHLLHQDFPKHYFFIGRILGKALYENLLVELPLAEFFLSKLVGRHSDVDVHHLASLDPIIYRNLLYLKTYEGDVTDLGLDFTTVSDELGETTVEELKPNGANIPVTSINRIEYIHLIADYKLNKQIRSQCNAFKQGLSNIISLDWLQMFSNKEFQVLISGAEIPVDVEDLKLHTNYGGGYTIDHLTIKLFWKVVDDFDDRQRRQLLKFVTSCSRPPLLGFKELDPPFCIQNAGSSERLPTASTCMNLLKLPDFQSESLLRDKLLYAIQSGAGFELS